MKVECSVQPGRGAGGAQPVGLVRHLARRGVEVDQVEAVLDQVQPELVAHQGGPALRLRPALDREAGVDPEPVCGHVQLPGLCTAALGRT